MRAVERGGARPARGAGALRRLAGVAALVLALALVAGPARAADDLVPGDATVADLRAAVSANADEGDAAITNGAKRQAFRRARELLKELQRIANQPDTIRPDRAPQDARAALAALDQAGLGSDTLAVLDFRWSLAAFTETPADSPDEAGELVALDAIVHDLQDAGQRVTAYVDLARAQAARGGDARMRRYATLATDELAQLAPADRSLHAQSILRLVAETGPDRLPGASSAVVGLLPNSAERAEAATRISLAALPADSRNLTPERLAAFAETLRIDGSLGEAAAAALAIPLADEGERADQLELVLEAALEVSDLPLATRIALGMADPGTQAAALRRIIASAIAHQLPLRAVDTPTLITVPRMRALGFLDLAADLGDRGYAVMADHAFAGAVAAAIAADDAGLIGAIAAAAARVGKTTLATRLANSLGADPAAAEVASALVVAFARTGDIAGAEEWLPRASGASERADALLALGEAAVAAGDLKAAIARADAVADDSRAGPLLASIARAAATSGDAATHAAVTARLGPGIDRASADIAGLGLGAIQPQQVALLRNQLAALPEADRRRATGELVTRLAGLGARADALDLAEPSDGWPVPAALRDGVLEAVARDDMARGNLAGAIALAAALADPAAAARLVADVAVAEAASGALLPALARIRALDDFRLRVGAFRAVAELLAGRHDRYGILGGGTATAGTDPALVVRPVEVDRTDAVRVVRLDGARIGDAAPRLPDFAIRAGDVRAAIPALEAGVTDLSLARLNRFNAKFFEDIVGTSARDFLFNAQTNINPTYVFLSRGVFTLGQVAAQLGDGGGWEIGRDASTITLRVPLVVGPFATLILSGAEAAEYRISATKGAFIVNAGRLYVVDTSLIAYDEEAGAAAFSDYAGKSRFRPFITAWSDSQTYVANSSVVGFGYSAGKTYGLSFTSGPRDIVALRDDSRAPTGILVDSSFDQMLYGFYSFEAEGISVIGNEYRDNIVYGIDPHDRSEDLRIAFNTAYGSVQKHGIIVSREVDHSYIVGNVAFANHGSGIMLDRDSVGDLVYANTSIGNRQDGISLFESSCNLIAANLVEANERSGIRVRNSADVAIAHNVIRDNHGSGLEAYVVDLRTVPGSKDRDFALDPFEARTTITAAWNTLESNGMGIALRGASEAVFHGNTFLRQTPKLYGGDLQSLRVRMLGFAAQAPVLVTGLCDGAACQADDAAAWLQRPASYSIGSAATACGAPAPAAQQPPEPAAEALGD